MNDTKEKPEQSLKTLWEILGSGEIKINWPAVEAEANDGDMCGDTGYWCMALMHVRAERDRLQAIVDLMPKTADGVPVVPGMMLYYPVRGHTGVIQDEALVGIPTDWDEAWTDCDECYSTKEAAEAAAKDKA